MTSPPYTLVDARFDTSDIKAAAHLRFALFNYLTRSWQIDGYEPFTDAEKVDLNTFKRFCPDSKYDSWQFYALIPYDLYEGLCRVWTGEDAIYPYAVGGQFIVRR